MDNKSFGIGILTLTAVALLIANLFAPRPASGVVSVSNSAMQAVTARFQGGGDALYLLDQDSGKLAVFTVKNGMQLRTVADVETGFRESNTAAAGGKAGK
jgi:hypothetical protein